MFHKVKNVNALSDYKLSVQFCEGVTKIYDVVPLFEKYSFFLPLKDSPELFSAVIVDQAVTALYGMMILTFLVTSFGQTVKKLTHPLTGLWLSVMPHFFGI